MVHAYRDWDGEGEMVTPSQVALMFVDWTDPVRASYVFCFPRGVSMILKF